MRVCVFERGKIENTREREKERRKGEEKRERGKRESKRETKKHRERERERERARERESRCMYEREYYMSYVCRHTVFRSNIFVYV